MCHKRVVEAWLNTKILKISRTSSLEYTNGLTGSHFECKMYFQRYSARCPLGHQNSIYNAQNGGQLKYLDKPLHYGPYQ